MYNIFIEPTNGRFANQLYPLFVALSIYEANKTHFNKIYIKNTEDKLSKNILARLNPKLFEVCEFDINKFDEQWAIASQNFSTNNLTTTQYNIRLIGYHQNNDNVNTTVIQKYLSATEEIKEQIVNLYGDLSDYICLHIRRGDYLWENNYKLYQVLTKEYIDRVINKYFSTDKIICISDDIKWCKDNLSNNANIKFADKYTDLLTDFYIQTLTKGNNYFRIIVFYGRCIIKPKFTNLCCT